MECLMKNMPDVEAFRGPKVNFLASFSNSANIGETPNPTHGCVDQMRSLKVSVHLPAKNRIRLAFFLSWICLLEFQAGHIGHDLPVSQSDVFNLVVQEYRLHYAFPLKGINPVWYDASWPSL